jgi:uncharacterized protein (UPF0147 family)
VLAEFGGCRKMKQRRIIDLLKKIASDQTQPDHVRREAVEALKNHERLSKEPEQK